MGREVLLFILMLLLITIGVYFRSKTLLEVGVFIGLFAIPYEIYLSVRGRRTSPSVSSEDSITISGPFMRHSLVVFDDTNTVCMVLDTEVVDGKTNYVIQCD